MTIVDILALPDGIEKAKQLAIEGLLTDGEHHKQWYLFVGAPPLARTE